MNGARLSRAFFKSLPRLFSGPVLLLGWLGQITHADLNGFWGMLLLVVVSFPLIFFVTVLLLSLVAFPWLRRVIQPEDRPLRASSGQVGLDRQVIEALFVSTVGLSLWVLSLVLFWLPPLSFVLSFGSLTWMQYRLMTFEMWSETESLPRLRQMQLHYRKEALVLSAAISGLALVPILNLLLPVFSALLFLQWDQELPSGER